MKEEEIRKLQEELEEFQREREVIKCIIGSIGGKISDTPFILNRDWLVTCFNKNYLDDI